MSEITYTLEQFVSDIQGLGTDVVYPYASLSGSSSSSCRLVAVNANTGAIQYSRNGSTRNEKVSGQMVQKLVSALGTRQAVEVNSLYGGSGNFRSALEALVVHTPHVFLCKIGGKKHIYWDPEHSHSSGTIELVENPSVALLGAVAESPQRAKDELGLIVGMRSPDSSYGVVTILDDDDYSYQVLCVNESKHSSGIRTISKPLLKEWIVAVKADPDKGAEAIRDDLTGKTDIDKFEYGNAGVLIKLAKMAVGQSGHSIVDVSSYWHRRMGRSERMNLPEADLLSIALKIFAEKRYEEEWQGKTSSEEHQSIYSMSDLTPKKLAEGSLDDFYNDFLLKVWVFKNGGSRKYAQLDEAEKTAYRQFVVDLKTQLKGFDAYFPPNTKCPAGMGVGMLTELMMRFWPKFCCSYNKLLIHDALVTLGMAEGDFVWPKTPSVYQDFMGKCATILRKMEQMKLPRRPNPNNDEPPDYITVNEFLWFVHDYKHLIKEEVMKKQMKEVRADVISAAGKKLALNADSKEDLLMLRLMSSLRAKPFVILAGHSGTGKSRIVRKLAYMTCNVKDLQDKNEGPLNFCMVQVKPNWHDSADLLGYRSAIKDNEYIGTKLVKFLFRAYAYPNTPFFLCLDEMNLAPVEQYFAEFLSAMESLKPVDKDDVDGKGEFTSDRVIDLDPDQDSNLYDLGCEWTAAYNWVKAHGFTIPKNLFVVGTVNMDETTCQFSRKVLDRAMTIEMTDASFADYGKVTEPDFDNLLEAGIIEKLIKRPVRIKVLDEDDAKADSTLMAVQRCLEKTPFAVAFRFANEYMLYKRAIKEFDPDGTMKVDSLDHVVLMKVLPRISGEKGYVANIFIGSEDIKNKLESPTPDSLLGIFKEAAQLSHGKMIDILSRKASYLTFWP